MLVVNKFRKYFSLLLVLAVISAKAFGIVPLAFGVGLVTGIETSLGTSIVTSLVIHGAALFGYLLWNDANPTAPTTTPALAVRLNPKAPLPTPPGWGAPVAPSVKPSPPSTDPGTVSTDGYDYTVLPYNSQYPSSPYLPFEPSADAAAADWIAYKCPSLGGTCSVTGLTGSPGSITVAWNNVTITGTTFSYWTGLTSRVTQKQCPAGYSLVSGNCTLSNPSLAMEPQDGRCNVMAVGNGFALNMNDPDCAAARLPSNVHVTSQSVTVTSEDGQTTTKIEKNAADGSSKMTVAKSRTDGSNKTDVNTISTSAPDGTTGEVFVNGTSSSVVDGTGVLAGANSGTGFGDMPTDYNREATQLEIRDSLAPTGDAPDSSFTDQKTDFDLKADDHKNVISDVGNKGQDNERDLLSWSWFPDLPSSVECTDAHVVLRGVDRVFTGWCDTITKLRDLMGYVLYVLTAFGLFAVLTGRNTGGGE